MAILLSGSTGWLGWPLFHSSGHSSRAAVTMGTRAAAKDRPPQAAVSQPGPPNPTAKQPGPPAALLRPGVLPDTGVSQYLKTNRPSHPAPDGVPGGEASLLLEGKQRGSGARLRPADQGRKVAVGGLALRTRLSLDRPDPGGRAGLRRGLRELLARRTAAYRGDRNQQRRRSRLPPERRLRGGLDARGRLVRLVARPDRLAPPPGLHAERLDGPAVVPPEPVLLPAPRLAHDHRRGPLPADGLPPVLRPVPGDGQLPGQGMGSAEPAA